jgi:MoaA/NifB/PqqE/SkfB family radical SAM enzyme
MEPAAVKKSMWAEVNEHGDVVIPREIAARYGLTPGSRVRLEEDLNHVRLHRPVTHLAKVYVEPTVRCNLDCRTCIRNVWDEELGTMSERTFDRVLAALRSVSSSPSVFFGGLGEPLLHPHIVDWIKQAKALGATVEMISNGTLLDEAMARALIDSGLDNLWISLDGARPESFADVRLGAELPRVIENAKRLRRMRRGGHFGKPEIDIAFVAMKRNIHELPDLLKLARQLDARQFKMSHVLPYTEELRDQILYARSLRDPAYMPSPRIPRLSLPRLEFNDDTAGPLIEALRSGFTVNLAGNNLGGSMDVCGFIEGGSIAVGWDGTLAPCLPLLHTHAHYFRAYQHAVKRHNLGNINDVNLLDVWLDPEYVQYRERVHSFAFAPCTFCGGCELLESNEEDCVGNTFPACGGCLWAQGLIQCP